MTRPGRKGSGQLALTTGDDGTGPVARMRRETDRAITELRRAGRLEAIDAGRVALLRTLADQIDAEVLNLSPNRYTIGALAGRWRDVESDLRGYIGPSSDAVDDFLRSLTASDHAPDA